MRESHNFTLYGIFPFWHILWKKRIHLRFRQHQNRKSIGMKSGNPGTMRLQRDGRWLYHQSVALAWFEHIGRYMKEGNLYVNDISLLHFGHNVILKYWFIPIACNTSRFSTCDSDLFGGLQTKNKFGVEVASHSDFEFVLRHWCDIAIFYCQVN